MYIIVTEITEITHCFQTHETQLQVYSQSTKKKFQKKVEMVDNGEVNIVCYNGTLCKNLNYM